MELSDCIKKRRSIRKYKNVKVERKVIEDILYHGTLAPSGHNRQPWYFVVVESDLKEKIAELVEIKNPEFGKKTGMAISAASVLVVVYNRYETKDDKEEMMDIQSIGACMENICLKAIDYDLGTLWVGLICNAEEEVNKLLDVNYKMAGAIALGVPDEAPNPRPREELNNLIMLK